MASSIARSHHGPGPIRPLPDTLPPVPSINGTEYLVILVVALLVFGPQRLPELAAKVGGWMREIRSVASDFRTALEAEVGDLKKPFQEAAAPLKDLASEAKSVVSESESMLEWKGPVHDQGPTPDDARQDFESLDHDAAETTDGGEVEET